MALTSVYLPDKFDALPDAATWSVRLRRTLVPLSATDEATIRKLLKPLVRSLNTFHDEYMNACKVTDEVRKR